MSQSDDDDYAFLGTPLEQFEEDLVPRKKAITVQDQIATDKHGRRRFHGAFTGGFSAGFYNTVGSLEGWTPSSFKSSRSSKADSKFQKPEDFMDEEDLEEFGIAPTVVRTKPEYSGNNKTYKRERIQFSEGPIPGEPVLRSILQPVRQTVGVLLLIKMGWKPGQGIGPRLTRLQKKKERSKNQMKIYGCSLPGQASDSDEGEDIDENIAEASALFAPEEHELHFLHPKMNTFGMGYSGLDKKSILSMNSNLKSETFKIFDNNKKLAIKGQAFGVGAFEEDDDDIYAKEDMSQYDFALDTSSSLREKRKKQREANRFVALTGSEGVIEGFVAAQNTLASKKFFPPPELPSDYKPLHPRRKTRFNAQPLNLNDNNLIKEKHFVTSEDRAAILGDKRPKNVAKEGEAKDDVGAQTSMSPLEGFRPFLADAEKQQRYEKYLDYIKIGAKDVFPSIQPTHMSEWEKERERSEFEQAARLYKPLSGMMAERFAHGELPDDSADPLSAVPKMLIGDDLEMVEAAKSKMYGKLTRKITDWVPCSLLCKRMNIADPLSGRATSLSQIADNKITNKSKFSVFSFLDVLKENADFKQEASTKKKDAESEKQMEVQNDEENLKKPLILPKPVMNFEEPMEKKDLFKAIFCSDEEDSDEDEKQDTLSKNEDKSIAVSSSVSSNSPHLTVANALRNTSPPRGIFANLDLDAINKRKRPSMSDAKAQPAVSNASIETEKVSVGDSEDTDTTYLYGPSLPTKPVFSAKQKEIVNVKSSSDSSSEGEWVERKEERKRHKKSKKNKVKKKRKNKSKKKN